MWGSVASVLIRAHRWRIPPESCEGVLPENSSRPYRERRSFTWSVCALSFTPLVSRPNVTFPQMVRHGKRWSFCSIYPILGDGPVTGSPSMRTLPEDGASSPAIIDSSVDFPQPDGPTMLMNSLSCMVSEISRMAQTSPSGV